MIVIHIVLLYFQQLYIFTFEAQNNEDNIIIINLTSSNMIDSSQTFITNSINKFADCLLSGYT